MNTEQVKGNWQILKGKIKEQWGKMTDDEIGTVEGQYDQVAGKIAVKYGQAKEEVSRKLKQMESDCGCQA